MMDEVRRARRGSRQDRKSRVKVKGEVIRNGIRDKGLEGNCEGRLLKFFALAGKEILK